MAEKNKSYDASNITVLEGLEAVRKRPGMYIGTTGIDGMHHLIWECFDNSRDEAMNGYADKIEVVLLKDETIRVSDNGRGIPVDIHPKTKKSALETIMTTLHAGGKFGDGGYNVSGGLHGVGVSVVNALSKKTSVVVHKDGDVYKQSYTLGKIDKKIEKLEKTKESGTIITFRADEDIFSQIKFDNTAYKIKTIKDRLRDQSYLSKGTLIKIIDARESTAKIDETKLFIGEDLFDAKTYSFSFDTGLKSFVKSYNKFQTPVHSEIFYLDTKNNDVGVEIALQYVDDISSRIFGFGNSISNPEGGTHITGFKTALTKTINSYSKSKKLKKDSISFTGDDVLEGLTAVVSVKLKEIQFEGQTKSKLGSVEAKGAVESAFGSAFSTFLEENPKTAKSIIQKINLAYEARVAARVAKDNILRKGALDGLTLPGKLTDCQSKNMEDSELFIVEGESAGGTAKQGRDRKTQAVLPLKGKILNVERVRLDKLLSSEEIKTLIIALGTQIGETFNIEKLRYGKIIIATDADVDGAHIRTLLLTLFYRQFKPLIESGHIYFATPPLFKIKKGKVVEYAYTDKEQEDIIKRLTKKDDSGLFVQRYKGLGEMNYEELRDTTMNKENRILKQVSIKEAKEADKVFDTLMGDNVLPRKEFIESNAKYAEVDI